MACRHHDGKECTLGLFGGRPSAGVCGRCDRYEGPPRGLGDVVHTVTRWVTLGMLEDCNGCQRRRRRWNKRTPKRKAR